MPNQTSTATCSRVKPTRVPDARPSKGIPGTRETKAVPLRWDVATTQMLRRAAWFIALVAVVLGLWRLWPNGRNAVTTYMGRTVPPGGLVIHPNGVGHPGDPGNAEDDLQRIYRALHSFIRANRRFPTFAELTEKCGLSTSDFEVPDEKFSDSYAPGQHGRCYGFAYLLPRPNGKPRPPEPAGGDRDVWLYSDIYSRDNEVVLQNGKHLFNPQGSYVVLWSDGQVERIAAKDVIWYRSSDGGWVRWFSGQADLPVGIRSVSEFYSHLGAPAG